MGFCAVVGILTLPLSEPPHCGVVFSLCCGRRPRRTTFLAFLDFVMGNGLQK